jgi:hypothetical protein
MNNTALEQVISITALDKAAAAHLLEVCRLVNALSFSSVRGIVQVPQSCSGDVNRAVEMFYDGSAAGLADMDAANAAALASAAAGDDE